MIFQLSYDETERQLWHNGIIYAIVDWSDYREERLMRQYVCECQECGDKHRVVITQPPYPEIGEIFITICSACNKETGHIRIEPRVKNR